VRENLGTVWEVGRGDERQTVVNCDLGREECQFIFIERRTHFVDV
jgi:hypothetical protein